MKTGQGNVACIDDQGLVSGGLFYDVAIGLTIRYHLWVRSNGDIVDPKCAYIPYIE